METDTKDKKQKERIGYGVRLPLMSFEDVIDTIVNVGNIAGHAGNLDALARIMNHSLSSSQFQSKTSYLKNLKLIILEKMKYALTELGENIASPHSPDERVWAVFEAFKNQDLLMKVWDNYKGKRLPQTEYLSNYIEKNLNIPPQFKIGWANYFVEAGKIAKILDEKEPGSFQVLLEPLVFKKPDEPLKDKELPDNNPPHSANGFEKPKDEFKIDSFSWGIVTKKVVSGNRQAIFAIPEELTQQDIDALKIVLKGIDIQLDGLKRNEE